MEEPIEVPTPTRAAKERREDWRVSSVCLSLAELRELGNNSLILVSVKQSVRKKMNLVCFLINIMWLIIFLNLIVRYLTDVVKSQNLLPVSYLNFLNYLSSGRYHFPA